MDLVPPQKFMRDFNDEWFKINGDKAVLEFANGSIINVTYDLMMPLPMLYSFDDVNDAAGKMCY